jgi:hypothetical protein
MSTQLALIESLWLGEEHPDWILDSLMGEGAASNRKLRLMAAAYCRRGWALVSDERIRVAIKASEDYADGNIELGNLAAAQADVEIAAAALPRSTGSARLATAVALLAASAPHTHAARRRMPRVSQSGRRWGRRNGVFDILAVVEALGNADASDRADYYRLLRDIFGNPFQPVSVHPAWRSPSVLNLAQAAYADRFTLTGELDPSRLRVLSDALEQVGCSDGEILGHLRSSGPHVRGCWPLDQLLKKE